VKALIYRRYGGPEVMELADVDEPGLGARDVRIRVRSASINPIDYKLRSGALKRVVKYDMPVRMGFDVSGVVTEAGMRAPHFKVGSRVHAYVQTARPGTLAETICAERTDVAPLPDGLSFDEGAAVPLAGLTAWQVLVDVLKVKEGQHILIHAGAGGVGTFAIQFAKHLGLTVATTASAPKHELLTDLGADACIDYRNEDFTADGPRYDLVFDAVGGGTLLKSFQAVKPGGVVASIVSLPDNRAAREMGLNVLARLALRWMNRKVYKAARQANATFRFHAVHPSEAQLRRIDALLAQGVVRVVIDRVYSLDEYAKAFAYLEAGHATGKIVVRVSEEPEETQEGAE